MQSCILSFLFWRKVHSFLNLISNPTHTQEEKNVQDVTGVIIEFAHIPQESPTGVQLLEQSVVCLP